METQLIVKGRKDGKPRRVEHIPQDVSQKNTPVVNRERNFRGFLMRYHGDHHSSNRVIDEKRIETVVLKPTGPLS